MLTDKSQVLLEVDLEVEEETLDIFVLVGTW